MAKVLIVDWKATPRTKWKRSSQLAETLRADGHAVNVVEHVAATDSPSTIAEDWLHLSVVVSATAADRDVIILHVGREQYGWHEALSGPYEKKLVVCFTGLYHVPGKCIDDCHRNPRHCYYPAAIAEEMGEQVLTAIARFVSRAEDSLRDDETLAQAKSDLMGFDPVLEAKLDLLYQRLEGATFDDLKGSNAWKMLEGHPVSKAALESVTNELSLKDFRDRLLPDVPAWAREVGEV